MKTRKITFTALISVVFILLANQFAAAYDCSSCNDQCEAGQMYMDCSGECTECGGCESCRHRGYCNARCDLTDSCSQCDNWGGGCPSNYPTCTDSEGTGWPHCQCVPEFSGVLGIVALLGAIGIPLLIFKLRKRK